MILSIRFKRTLATLLCGMTCLSVLPSAAHATNGTKKSTATTKQTQEDATTAEQYFALIPSETETPEDVALGAPLLAENTGAPSVDDATYSLFNFNNTDTTWESDPTMGKGANYPSLNKTCDSSTFSTQGISGPDTTISFGYPVENVQISSFFGWRKIFGRIHYGIDFTGPRNTPIIASADGTVTTATTGKNSGSFGVYVELYHGDYFNTLYAHMEKVNVKAGDKVKKGDVIGFMGSTGATQAVHLHYEIRHKGIAYNPFLGYLELPSNDSVSIDDIPEEFE